MKSLKSPIKLLLFPFINWNNRKIEKKKYFDKTQSKIKIEWASNRIRVTTVQTVCRYSYTENKEYRIEFAERWNQENKLKHNIKWVESTNYRQGFFTFHNISIHIIERSEQRVEYVQHINSKFDLRIHSTLYTIHKKKITLPQSLCLHSNW